MQWLSTIPPLLFILAYKIYINRVHVPAFQYFIPTEDEIRLARVHSERADARGNRLEKRFGHPALHMDLFTPMLHAKMMPLLSQVYQGKIGRDEAKMDEYGGQKLEAQVVPGGIKIAAVSQVRCHYLHIVDISHSILFRTIWNMIQLCISVIGESWIGTRVLWRLRPCSMEGPTYSQRSHNITQVTHHSRNSLDMTVILLGEFIKTTNLILNYRKWTRYRNLCLTLARTNSSSMLSDRNKP